MGKKPKIWTVFHFILEGRFLHFTKGTMLNLFHHTEKQVNRGGILGIRIRELTEYTHKRPGYAEKITNALVTATDTRTDRTLESLLIAFMLRWPWVAILNFNWRLFIKLVLHGSQKKNLTFHDTGNMRPINHYKGLKWLMKLEKTNWHSPFAHPSITMQNIFNALFPNCIITQT